MFRENWKCHNFLIFQPIFIRFSLFYLKIFTLSSEIKLNLFRISPLKYRIQHDAMEWCDRAGGGGVLSPTCWHERQQNSQTLICFQFQYHYHAMQPLFFWLHMRFLGMGDMDSLEITLIHLMNAHHFSNYNFKNVKSYNSKCTFKTQKYNTRNDK